LVIPQNKPKGVLMEKNISFLFQPYNIEGNQHTYEKALDNGKKKRYLKGIASGTQIDGHGERITENCIKSFQRQSDSGDILLYTDKHGVAYTDDIGILEKGEILPNFDWMVDFRLYDEDDGVGQTTLDTSNKLWNQMNGLPPYKHKKQKGFSIEGIVPDNGILKMEDDGRRVVNDVVLDGCVVVPRPAYQTSIAHSLYKALDEKPPWQIEKMYNSILRKSIEDDTIAQGYYKKVYVLNDTLEEQVEKIMIDPTIEDKEKLLESLFEEYKTIMISTIIAHPTMFEVIDPYEDSYTEVKSVYDRKPDKSTILKSLLSNLDQMESLVEKSI